MGIPRVHCSLAAETGMTPEQRHTFFQHGFKSVVPTAGVLQCGQFEESTELTVKILVFKYYIMMTYGKWRYSSIIS
jgi:hypothetical protein